MSRRFQQNNKSSTTVIVAVTLILIARLLRIPRLHDCVHTMFLFESEGDIFSQFAVFSAPKRIGRFEWPQTVFSQSRHAESEQEA